MTYVIYNFIVAPFMTYVNNFFAHLIFGGRKAARRAGGFGRYAVCLRDELVARMLDKLAARPRDEGAASHRVRLCRGC